MSTPAKSFSAPRPRVGAEQTRLASILPPQEEDASRTIVTLLAVAHPSRANDLPGHHPLAESFADQIGPLDID
jgi:hypothetical protein